MSLEYDFDIVTSEDGEKVALFRSAGTVEALKGADAAVQDFFMASGFAFDTHNSGAGPGFYPATDEAARVTVIEKLSENLFDYEIAEADLNGFDMDAFMTHLAEAEPIEMKHSAFSFGLPVGRLLQTFRNARPTRQTG